jgi:hypothetical protein
VDTTNQLSSDKDIHEHAVRAAAEEFIARRDFKRHPAHEDDAKGRMTVASSELRKCCNKYKRQRHALNMHCRTLEHVCSLFDVGEDEVTKILIELTGE